MYNNVRETVEYIFSRTDHRPEIALILGSGLGDLADELEYIDAIDYKDIPHFNASKIEGHKNRLVFGNICGKNVVVMQGRMHYYEGMSQQEITYPIKVFKELGVDKLLVTNAAGACNKSYEAGDLMIIKDHINFSGSNPLIGSNDDRLGPRFPDMSDAYDKSGVLLLHDCAETLSINVREGVYMFFSGPSYETPAEVKMASILGADAVGMSTVPEVIVARYLNIRVFGISCITNMGAGIQDSPLNHSEVIETTKIVKKNFSDLIKMFITKI